jgi:hypothetical protein
MKKIEEVRRYIEALSSFYNESGRFYTSQLQEDDTLFTVLESWSVWEEFITNVIVYAELEELYREALGVSEVKYLAGFSFVRPAGRMEQVLMHAGKVRALPYGELRLGRNNLFPGDFYSGGSEDTRHYGSTPYQVPEQVQDIEEVIKEIVGETGFVDSYARCSNCGKILRSSPDSYGWTPDYTDIDGEYYCQDCTLVDEVLENYACTLKSLPSFVRAMAKEEGTIVEMKLDWENGFHHGMDDSPEKIVNWLKEHDIEKWWWNVRPSQFNVDFSLLLQTEDIEKLAKLWTKDMGETQYESGTPEDLEVKANRVLESIDSYQGYSTSGELDRALRNQPTEHVRVITTTVVDGIVINRVKNGE